MFWGLIMEPNKRYSQTVEKAFHLSMASLDASTAQTTSVVQVMICYDNRNYLLCTLQKGSVWQVPLDLNFAEGTKIAFTCNGDGHVHLTGYLVPEEEGLDEFDDFEEDEEEEDEEIPQLVAQKKRKAGSSPVEQKKPTKKSKIAEEDDDDDESDSDIQNGMFDDDSNDDFDDDDEEIEDEDDEDDDDSEEEDEEDEEEEEKVEEKVPEKLSKNQKKKLKQQQKQQQNQQNQSQNQQQNKKEKTKLVNGKADAKPEQQQGKQKKTKEDSKTEEKSEQQQKKRTVEGGVQVEELKEGSGAIAKPGKFVSVYYIGRLKNGKKFDATNSGNGFKFRLGKGEVIKGWDSGVAGMKVGGKRRLVIPPAMAYGARGSPPVIPPNSTLTFEVELKAVH